MHKLEKLNLIILLGDAQRSEGEGLILEDFLRIKTVGEHAVAVMILLMAKHGVLQAKILLSHKRLLPFSLAFNEGATYLSNMLIGVS
jgi:hypothetical protein